MSINLSEAVSGAAATGSARPSMNDLFVDPRTLPTPPVAVLEIMHRSDDPDVPMAEIVALIESDVSIAVQVLRLANSALYAPGSEITTVARATSMLGLRTIRLLTLTTSLRALVPQRADRVDFTDVRERMVVNAAMARRAADVVAPTERDEAFTAGLLTGLGAIVLALRAPSTWEMLRDDGDTWPSCARERELLGYSLDDVTASLIDQWGLPEVLGDSIRRRSEPLDPGDDPLSASLKLALLAESIVTRNDVGDALPRLRDALAERVEWPADESDRWVVEAESVVTDTAEAIQFRIPRGDAYSDLLIEATERLEVLQHAMEHDLLGGGGAVTGRATGNGPLTDQATDPLTSLPGRRAFEERVAAAVADSDRRSRLVGRTLGLLILHVDRCKEINDAHGYSVGDEVLRQVGELLRRQTRGNDVAARFGDEEFAMLIADTSRDELFAVAERLRLAVAELEVPVGGGPTVQPTVSVGAALNDSAVGDDAERTLIALAERRLASAKRGGYNRTWLA